MACCGQSRQALTSASNQSHQTPGAQSVPFPKTYGLPVGGAVTFEYQGRQMLTVIGQGTGAQYHFIGHGSRATVDSRDRASLLAVPGLRLV